MTKTESKHTKTPWHRNIPPVEKYPILFAGRNTHVLQVITRGMSAAEAEANTEFVLRAVNSHDSLVEALRDLLPFVERARMPEEIAMSVQAARAAIAKASLTAK